MYSATLRIYFNLIHQQHRQPIGRSFKIATRRYLSRYHSTTISLQPHADVIVANNKDIRFVFRCCQCFVPMIMYKHQHLKGPPTQCWRPKKKKKNSVCSICKTVYFHSVFLDKSCLPSHTTSNASTLSTLSAKVFWPTPPIPVPPCHPTNAAKYCSQKLSSCYHHHHHHYQHHHHRSSLATSRKFLEICILSQKPCWQSAD